MAESTVCSGLGPDSTAPEDDLLAWNLGRSRASAAIDGLGSFDRTAIPSATVLVDNYRPSGL